MIGWSFSLPENQTASDRKTTFRSYLCPTLNHHPWCPSVPGQHGFIFVGLGKEKESYKVPVFRNLFVGLPKSESKGRIFRYLGKYRVHRVKHLTVEEWESLPAGVCFTIFFVKEPKVDWTLLARWNPCTLNSLKTKPMTLVLSMISSLLTITASSPFLEFSFSM